MSYIDDLLEKRETKEITPFWKLQVTDEELSGLVEYIKDVLSRNSLSGPAFLRERQFLKFDREACLMYALWWNQKYDGGKQSWEEALTDFGFSKYYKKPIIEAVKNELENNKRLNIKIFRGQVDNRMFLQSLLAQGGLPMKLMEREGSSSFEDFLYHLISEYEDVDYRDWSNISVAQELAEKYIINKTLRESPAVLDFALEITKAYINNDEISFYNYEVINKMIKRIREKRVRAKRPPADMQFRVNWQFKLKDNKLELFYSIKIPTKIVDDDPDDNTDESNFFSYYVDGQLIGSYHLNNNSYLLIPGTSSQNNIKWNGHQTSINLQLSRKNQFTNNEPLINSAPPYVEEPMLLQLNDDLWLPKQNKAGEAYACLMPSGWECKEEIITSELEFNGKILRWLQLDWDNEENHEIEFINNETSEEVILNNEISKFSVSFTPYTPEWIEESSATVLVNNDKDLRMFFHCFNDQRRCSNNFFKFKYKSALNKKYKTYHKETLPEGRILMKVIFPDQSKSKTFSFYNINGLSYGKFTKDTISVQYSNGRICLLSNQNIEDINNSLYKVTESDNLDELSTIKFRLYFEGSKNTIDLGFTTPLQKSCFVDSKGMILDNHFPIAIDELYKYKLNLAENDIINLEYWEGTNEGDERIISKRMSLDKGKYSLDILREDITRFIYINGFNDYKKFITVKIANSKTELLIRKNAYRAQDCINEYLVRGLYVTRKEEPVSGLALRAIAINATKGSALFRKDCTPLAESGRSGFYVLPDLEDDEQEEFVIIPDNNLNEGHMLAYFLNTKREESKKERATKKYESIEYIQKLLLSNNEEEWENTWFYMGLAIKYRLPYLNTFNTFLAIAGQPELLAMFITKLPNSSLYETYDENTLIEELQRMEQELSFGFHYIPSEYWNKIYKQKIEEHRELIKNNPILKNVLKDEMTYAYGLFKLLEGLMKEQLGDSPMLMLVMQKLLTGIHLNEDQFDTHIQNYLIKVNDALEDFSSLVTPTKLNIPKIEYQKLNPWKTYGPSGINQKMQFLAIMLPQCAAQYAFGANMHLWNYESENSTNAFIRRMINYMRIYASEAYNSLFITSILREPVTQD